MKDIIEVFDQLERKKNQLFAYLGRKYFYSDLILGVKSLASLFKENKLEQGDRVIISSKDNYILSLFFLACLRNGIVAIPLDPEVGIERANQLANLTEPKGFFIDKDLANRWQLHRREEFIFEINWQNQKKGTLFKKLIKPKSKSSDTLGTSFQEILDKLPLGELPAVIDPKSIAYILFTSGTTSVPKAVQISHRALYANLNTLSSVYRLDKNSRLFNILTIYHTDGLIQGPVLAAYNGITWYHPWEFNVDKISSIFDAIYKYRISHMIAVPTILAFLDKFSEGYEDSFDNEDFKYIITSASTINKAFWQAFEKKFNTTIVNNYGLTETVVGASYSGPDRETRKIGTIGKPIDCSFKIIGEGGLELGSGQKGELLIKGDNLFSGYFNSKESTIVSFKDDWFCTGDIALKDEKGFYYIVGRKKNIVISGGINIQPEEVTEVVNKHPEVVESTGFGKEDEFFGERLVLCVVRKEGSNLDEISIITFCRKFLEPAKIPKKVYFLPALPKTSSGKIRILEVKNQINKQSENAQLINGQLRESILSAASASFNVSKEIITIRDSSLSIDGWDSMAHLIFITQLEEQFNLEFSTKEIMIMNSLATVEHILKQKLN